VLGPKWNELDIERMMRSLDRNRDGKINYSEFVKMMQHDDLASEAAPSREVTLTAAQVGSIIIDSQLEANSSWHAKRAVRLLSIGQGMSSFVRQMSDFLSNAIVTITSPLTKRFSPPKEAHRRRDGRRHSDTDVMAWKNAMAEEDKEAVAGSKSVGNPIQGSFTDHDIIYHPEHENEPETADRHESDLADCLSKSTAVSSGRNPHTALSAVPLGDDAGGPPAAEEADADAEAEAEAEADSDEMIRSMFRSITAPMASVSAKRRNSEETQYGHMRRCLGRALSIERAISRVIAIDEAGDDDDFADGHGGWHKARTFA